MSSAPVTGGDFVHLHVHTEYSMLDGAARLDDLFRRTGELGMTSIAMTDHGNVFGAYDFYSQGRPRRASSRSSAWRPTSRPTPAASRRSASGGTTGATTTSAAPAPTPT